MHKKLWNFSGAPGFREEEEEEEEEKVSFGP